MLLGMYELALDGVPLAVPSTSKARSLLAYLALRAGEPVRRERLMDEFWPDADPTSARNNLKTTLSAIRRVFRNEGADPDDILHVERDTVLWAAAAWIDAREFERCSWEIADERRWALELYRGEFAPQERTPWADELRERLAMRFEQMLRVELREAPSNRIAERLLALDPFSDEAYAALIEQALRDGDRRRARTVYARYAAALAELGEEPPADLAARAGVRTKSEHAEAFGFCGRSDELAQIEALVDDDGTRVVLLSGIAGIGKSTLACEASQRFSRAGIEVFDADASSLDDAGWVEQVTRAPKALVCVRLDVRASVRAAFPFAAEIALGPLAREEVTLALHRRFGDARAEVIDAIWQRSGGYPLVLAALVNLAEEMNDAARAVAVSRVRLPRAVERRLEAQLREAGDDVWEIATLLALEPQLDNDDVAALLEWTLQRAADARGRLAPFRYSVFDEIVVRSLTQGRREQTVERIAERLLLHEHPSARMRIADHLRALGRDRAAAQAYAEAASLYAAFASWENVTRACDAGIELLDGAATSSEALAILRDLYAIRGRALYQRGAYIPAVRSIESLLDISQPGTHAALRSSALVTMGHALARGGSTAPAEIVAQQALAESRNAGSAAEFQALHLLCRVLRDRAQYDEVVGIASEAFERAIAARDWTAVMLFGNMLIEVSRRQLRLEECFDWARRERDASVLAGPMLEAEACFMLASVKFVVNRAADALDDLRHAQALTEGLRRRSAVSATPTQQLDWMLHHGLTHAYNALRRSDEAIAEVEWLLRSPWSFNSMLGSAQVVSVTIETRLQMGSPRDIEAARALLDRIAPPREHQIAQAIDSLARARVAAHYRTPEALYLLHQAFKHCSSMAHYHPDQVHTGFGTIAEAARGIDDTLAARSAALARRYESAVIAAAGALWRSDAIVAKR